MRRPPRPLRIASLCDSLHRRLNAYALTASAAGVSLLALELPAGGKIIYTPANVRVRNGHGIDLNHDGMKDFVFVTSGTNHGGFFLGVRPGQPQNQIWGTQVWGENVGFASALRGGAAVGSNQALRANNEVMYGVSFQTYSSFWGFWQNVHSRYLGLKFYIHGKAHYGWARLNVKEERGTLTGYAYETVPDKAIITGKTRDIDEISGIEQSGSAASPAIVEPVSLGRLAQGAHGLGLGSRLQTRPNGHALSLPRKREPL
jgi:hypothetical protein